MVDTYIFRFRDLGKEEGFTIKQHNAISKVNGYVWWGWWGKSGECFPDPELGTKLDTESFKVFLFDSGQQKFYQTTLQKIHSTRSGNRKVKCPEDGKYTPTYYNSDELLGWLKFSEIEEIQNDVVLKKYSYIAMNQMFTSSIDMDEQLFNKFVFSELELQKQDRTIWKVRTIIESDSRHESLAKHYTPHNFTRKYSQKNSELMVWLSDVHFDKDGQKHQFPFEDTIQHQSLLTKITELVGHYDNGSKCAAVAISGDLTWQSQEEGFDRALKLTKDLMSSLSLTPDDLIICPGNHDVGFVDIEEYCTIFEVEKSTIRDGWNNLAREYNTKSQAGYVAFYNAVFQRQPEPFLTQGRKFLLGGARVVEVAALNSCMLQQVGGELSGIGYLSSQQLEQVGSQMGWIDANGLAIEKKKGVIRIAMLHHHLLPVNETEDGILNARYSVVLDAERLMSWVVKHKVDYVLHGHMHKCNHVTLTRKLKPLEPLSQNNPEHTFEVVSLGSSGVAITQLPESDCSNYVCVIDFSEERPIFNFHKLTKSGVVDKTPAYVIGK